MKKDFHLKQFGIFAAFLMLTSLASANLIQQHIAQTSSKIAQLQYSTFQTVSTSDSFESVNTQILNNLTDVQFALDKANKMDFLYFKLFDYSSHINHTNDHEGLTVFWKGTLIANAIDAVWARKYLDIPLFITNKENDILQIAANGLKDNYTNNTNGARLNEVPLPAAAWLFTSAIVLFGFARRNNI